MGQDGVLKLLEKEKRYMNTKEISEKLYIQRTTINENIRKLYKDNFITLKKIIVRQKSGKGDGHYDREINHWKAKEVLN